MIDVVEELRDVDIHHPILPFLRVLLRGSYGILCAAPRSKSIAVLAEHRIEDRRQRLQQHLLNQPIHHRRDSQHPRPPARLRYLYPPHRSRNPGPRQQLRPNLRPVRLKMTLQFLRRHVVDPRRALIALHRFQRSRPVLFPDDLFHQVLVHCSLSEGSRNGVTSPSPSARRGFTASAPGIRGVAAVVAAPHVSGLFGPFQSPRKLHSLVLRPFAPAALPAFFATTASADFSSTLVEETSPGKAQNLFPRAVRLYPMRL